MGRKVKRDEDTSTSVEEVKKQMRRERNKEAAARYVLLFLITVKVNIYRIEQTPSGLLQKKIYLYLHNLRCLPSGSRDIRVMNC